MSEPLLILTPEEYLEIERSAEVRHEYVDGQVYALAGARAIHQVIAGNLYGLLWQHLEAGPCRVLASEMKLRAAADCFYYPDLMVQCEAIDPDSEYLERPRYVVEVSSPSTQRIDCGEKADAYWRVPSIEAYVMIAQSAMQVVVLRRAATQWETEILTRPEDTVRLDGIGFACSLAAIYAHTELG
jgi:Uma2 family endonuclease